MHSYINLVLLRPPVARSRLKDPLGHDLRCFRFASQPPVRLYELMTECETRTLWTVLAVTQTPAFFTLWYVARTTIREEVGFPGSDAGTWAVCGMALEPVGLVRRRPGGGVRVLVLPLRGMIDIKEMAHPIPVSSQIPRILWSCHIRRWSVAWARRSPMLILHR